MSATETKTYKVVYTATADWLDIAYPIRGNGIDWDADPINGSEWDAACEACGFDPEDSEVGFGLLIEPRECDTVLKAGDIVCVQGFGGDVAFLRILVATVFADECEGPGRMTAEADANARLIASAPDLLEALEHLIRFCPQPEMEQTHYDEEPSYVSAEAAALAETIFRAQSAIAAARGE